LPPSESKAALLGGDANDGPSEIGIGVKNVAHAANGVLGTAIGVVTNRTEHRSAAPALIVVGPN